MADRAARARKVSAMSLRIDQKISENVHGDIVLGRNRSFPRTLAMNLLPKSGLRGAEGLLAQVLMNGGEQSPYRRLAAANLLRMNTPRSHEALVRAAETVNDDRTLLSVVKALGRVGGREDLGKVTAIRDRATGILKTQASFAATMISYRFGMEGNVLPAPTRLARLPAGPRLPLQFRKPPQQEIDLFNRTMAEEPCGIEWAAQSLQTFQCPGGHWMIALNNEVFAGDALQLLGGRKTMLGVLAAKREEDERYSPSYFLFSHPHERGIQLTLTRVTGDLAWAGTAEAARREKRSSRCSLPARRALLLWKSKGCWLVTVPSRSPVESHPGASWRNVRRFH